MVRLVFEGDPIPADERDKLVPVRTEGSADEDLLEDSQSAIESYLHARGYRDAMAPYTREERAGELIITFKVTRGRATSCAASTITGNVVLPTPELLPLIRLKEGEPFVRSTLTMGVSAIENTVSRVGVHARAGQADRHVVAPEDPRRPGPARQRDDRDRRRPRTEVALGDLPGQHGVERCRAPQAHLDGARACVFRRRCRRRSRRDRAGLPRTAGSRASWSRRGRCSPRTTRAPTSASPIIEGPQIIVDHVIIAGNRRISTETIEREIVLQSRRALGDAAVVAEPDDLNRLELFRRVQIEALAHSGEPRRDVLVQVEEAPPTTVDLGGGVEGGRSCGRPAWAAAEDRFELTPRGSFQVGRRNLWGKNRSVTLFTRVSLRTRDTQVEQTQLDPPEPIESSYGFHEYRVARHRTASRGCSARRPRCS